MDEEQKNRLEQELKFLSESLEADVISKDEYERGKERIEMKITELEQETPVEEKPVEEKPVEEKPVEEKPVEESTESQKSEEVEAKPQSESPSEQEVEEVKEEIPVKEDIEIKEIKPQPTKIIGAEREIIEEKSNEEEKPEEKGTKITEEPSDSEEITLSKKWIYGIAILILAAILFFSLRGCINENPIEEFVPDCLSDSDCKQEGTIGTCSNPDTEEAECQFKQDASTNLIVINDNDCELCDSSRIKNTIKKIFPNVQIQNIDYGAEEAKQLIIELNIDALPAYIFDSDVSLTVNFNDFKRALIKKGDSYVMTNTASGANYYFKREEIENRLDSFSTTDISEKADSNLNEFLGLFEDSIDFEKHIVSAKDKTQLKNELGITSYPAFLINNQIKFGGVQSSDSIKDKFCKLNEISGCEKELRKNII